MQKLNDLSPSLAPLEPLVAGIVPGVERDVTPDFGVLAFRNRRGPARVVL